ncbi:MAG: hypothetical protein HYV40_02400 [Candidatus Levybacteria bacterium]|nr:hypothetical protein [Candidatus Levybacteria bacterium]
MGRLDGIAEGIARRTVTSEKKVTIARHKAGTSYESRGQKLANKTEILLGRPGKWSAERVRGTLEMLGGHSANKNDHHLLEGYTYIDKGTGSTERISGIREDDLVGLGNRREAIVADMIVAKEKALGRTLDPGEKAAIEAQGPEIFRELSREYINQLGRSKDKVARRKENVILNQILEHANDNRYALGLDGIDPAEQALYNDAVEFLKVADQTFTKRRIEELKKKWLLLGGGALAVFINFVTQSATTATDSAPTRPQQHGY